MYIQYLKTHPGKMGETNRLLFYFYLFIFIIIAVLCQAYMHKYYECLYILKFLNTFVYQTTLISSKEAQKEEIKIKF